MFAKNEPVSAFAAYAMKRKTSEPSVQTKRFKKKHNKVEEKDVDRVVNKHKKTQPLSEHKNNKLKSNTKLLSKTNTPPVKQNANTRTLNGTVTIKRKNNNTNKNMKRNKLSSVNDSLSINSDNVFENNFYEKKSNLQVNQVQEGKKNKKQKKGKKLNRKAKLRAKLNSEANSDAAHDNNSQDPTIRCKMLFEWLIYPLKIDHFFKNNWEETPLHIKRQSAKYYKLLMSTPLLDKILRENYILFTKNIDITSYSKGKRETHNPPGRAVPSVVWDYYLNGCSVRMLNPQTFIPKLHMLNATLQEFFGCFVGANSYLTPPNSQGFAPHYDDIEAFILQIEGKKRWRLYKPQTDNDYLPRYSSRDFDQSEIGKPILDTVIQAGDLLYLPRGTIHQGETIDNSHSLHITLSVYQRNSWGDFLEKLLPDALQEAITNNSRFREGLPVDYLKYTGFVNSTNKSERRESFKEKIRHLFNRLIEYVDIDKAADSMAKSHMHDFLPPVLTEYEQECSIAQDGEIMTDEGVVKNRVEIEPDTKIRLLRSHCIRLVEESDAFRIYHSCENSKEYHEYEPQFLELGEEFVPAVKEIIHRYPEFIRVEDLPIDAEDDKIQIAKDLWEKGIIITEEPLPILD